MTIEEFGQSIQAKYPQYANKSALDVGNAMLAKYPQYKDRVNGQPSTTSGSGTTTDNPQYSTSGLNPGNELQAGNSAAQFLGIQKFGAGLATAGRVASGSVNQTGDENVQSLRDTTAVTNALHQLIAQGVPANDLRRMQLVNFLQRQQNGNADPAYHAQGTISTPTQAQIDPGTQLSNKEVLGSAGNVALLATGGGELKGADAVQPLLEGGGLAGKVLRGGALGYASDVAQHANNNDQSIFKPGFGTAVGAGLPILTAVGGAIQTSCRRYDRSRQGCHPAGDG